MSKTTLPEQQNRFKIVPFTNRAGSQSWRVTGIKRDGTRIRENHPDTKAAHCRLVELEAEYWARAAEDTHLRATKLTDTQIKIAEIAFPKLDRDDDLLLAVECWRKHGQQSAVEVESPRLDDAAKAFTEWLDASTLRDRTKGNLKVRLNVFANSVGNYRINEITPEVIDGYLDNRNVAASTKDNDRRVLSRFFSWCMDRKRRWTMVNPCAAVRVEQDEKAPPTVLTLAECERLLRKAEKHRRGRLAPYVAVCLFGGLRPFEAQRLTWEQVNTADKEIRLEAHQTKTKRPRTIAFNDGPKEQKPFNAVLQAWLSAYNGKPFFPPNWRRDFDEIKKAAGFGGRGNGEEKDKANGLKAWPEDLLRHTAISHFFRLTGSYGRAAEMFDNSESIIKQHYQGRVSSEDTKKFFALLPKKGRPAKKGRK